jgi:protein-disulfide isomerase
LQALLDKDSSIAIAFRHFPIENAHPMADGAARAAICAELQDRFAEMHTLLFETDEWRKSGDWAALASEAGVPNLTLFMTCLTGEVAEDRLEADRTLAEILGIRATPTFFYRSGAHVGYLDEKQLASLLESLP